MSCHRRQQRIALSTLSIALFAALAAGPVAAQEIEHRLRVILRARNKHAPAEQGLDLEPVQLVPLLDHLAHNDDASTCLTCCLGHGPDLREGADQRR